ncbi:hypothetical protein AMTRI_Chr11g153930 [Amborella trichopoda]
MLYLGKNPILALPNQDKHPLKAQSHASIFSINESCLFQEFSLLHMPPQQQDDGEDQRPTTAMPWQWCALPSSEQRLCIACPCGDTLPMPKLGNPSPCHRVSLITTTVTLLGHHLYVAGGPSLRTTSRYDLHPKIWCSAEFYDPIFGAWTLIEDFVPQPTEEWAMATLGKRLVMLTRGGESWQGLGAVPGSVGLGPRRAEIVPVGNEMWVVVGGAVGARGGGVRVWPTFPGPGFWLEGGAVRAREG